MEISTIEMSLVKEIDNESREQSMSQLTELQLALIGGGSTVDSFH